MNNIAIQVENLSKHFKLPHEKRNSLKSLILRPTKMRYEKLEILKNVGFTVNKGDFFGILGRNGSGKSTLLKLMANIYIPSSGHITRNGNITAFIELGVGFNSELTGKDNVFLNGIIFGMSREEIEAKYEQIVAFAELEKFMDQKLKNYSSGMQVRLAFSIAIQANTEILIIDEVLAVGDVVFQQKCFKYFKELKKNKKTVIFVSHDIASLREYCNKGILLEEGKIVAHGEIGEVVDAYLASVNKSEENKQDSLEIREQKKVNQYGTGEIKVHSCNLTDQKNISKSVFSDTDDYILVKVVYETHRETEEPVYGVSITDLEDQRIFVSNTLWSKIPTKISQAGSLTEVIWKVPNIFNTGEFVVSPAVADRSGSQIYDWREALQMFKVRKKLNSTAVVNVEHDIIINQK